MPTKNELMEEVNSLKRKLDQKEEELASSKSKQERVLQQLKDKIECPVCMDLPRSGPVPVCPNGHFVCKTCRRDSCPTCRIPMGTGESLLASTLLENIKHKCRFVDCNENLPAEAIEKHEAACSQRTVSCPFPTCPMEVPLPNLLEHLKSSKRCSIEEQDPLALGTVDWNSRNFRIPGYVSFAKDVKWKVHIYSFSSELFAIFPRISEKQIFFVIVMFASEIECSKFNVEIIVHAEESHPLDSKTENVKFQGSPLSVDAKGEHNCFGCSERLMAKILKKSATGDRFIMSFKITKMEAT